jgi:hypothetical protein
MGAISDLLVGKAEHTSQKGNQSQWSNRAPAASLKQQYDLLRRALTDQMVNPPNTAISVPTQQAISNLQGGFGGLSRAFGVGGTGTGQTGGLQSREQMGLPDRASYFPNMPTNEQITSLGLPSVRQGDSPKKRGPKAQAKWDQSHIA